MNYLITPQQTISTARQAGLDEKALSLSGMAILTFSKAVVNRLVELCMLEDAEWISHPHHPYSAAELVKRGTYRGMDVIVLVPPMGASPLACILEDLAACGAQMVFLVCAAWLLGPPVKFGDLIVPSFSMGPDGTSIHYGNRLEHILASPQVVKAFKITSDKMNVNIHVGGNASCEALYRITPKMVSDFRLHGCYCMDNGEVNTLFAVTHSFGILGGALLQPYIDLQAGWDPARIDDAYAATCRHQAEIALETGIFLKENILVSEND